MTLQSQAPMQKRRIPGLNRVFISGVIINRLHRRRGRGSDGAKTGVEGKEGTENAGA